MSKLLSIKERTARGTAMQTDVTGKAAPAAASPVEESWRDFVFAEVWARPGLERRARFLIAIAGAAITSAGDGILDGYVRGALTTKDLSLLELREGALHMAVYGGWGRGDAINRSIDRVAAELGLASVDYPPIRAADWDPEVRTKEGTAEFINVMTFPGSPSVAPYLEAINNFVFGEMWCRPGLDQRSRRWMTLVGVCDSGIEIPMKSHLWAAMASGNCEPAEMQEFALQYAIHAGWPKGSIIQQLVFEMIAKIEAGLPYDG